MAGTTRDKTASVARRLSENPSDFTFNQALWLLGFLNSDTPEGADKFLRGRVTVRPWLSLAFPPSEVTSVERDESDRNSFTVTVPFYGLYSTMGALPTFYTEELMDEARDDKSVSRDFLDIINNHMYHLLYAAARHSDIQRRTVQSANKAAEFVQYSMMGQSEKSLRDDSLNALAAIELFAQRPRSAVRLERYLAFVLNYADCERIEVEQCVGRRAKIPKSQRSQIGLSNCTLGETAVLGCEIIDFTGKFRIHLRDVPPQDVEKFLPSWSNYRDFHDKVREYLDSPQEFDLRLHPCGDNPPVILGENSRLSFYLGNKAEQPVAISWKKR